MSSYNVENTIRPQTYPKWKYIGQGGKKVFMKKSNITRMCTSHGRGRSINSVLAAVHFIAFHIAAI